ncbi:MAG: hypothetical protein ACFFCS_03450 [Candidatus Hodarchaeota archaeon]
MDKEPRDNPNIITLPMDDKEKQKELLEKMKKDWEESLPNRDVECRLRINGAFGLRCGNKQVCLMTGQTMNTTFNDHADDQVFDCKNCPDPKERGVLLEFYKDNPDCDQCKINMATKDAPKEEVPRYYDLPSKETYDFCISCYAGVEYERLGRKADKFQEQLKQMEQDYKDGKIPYSAIVDFKEKAEKDLGTMTR